MYYGNIISEMMVYLSITFLMVKECVPFSNTYIVVTIYYMVNVTYNIYSINLYQCVFSDDVSVVLLVMEGFSCGS